MKNTRFLTLKKLQEKKKVVAQILQAKKHDGLKTKFQKLAYFFPGGGIVENLGSIHWYGEQQQGKSTKIGTNLWPILRSEEKERNNTCGLQPTEKKNFLDRSLKSPPEKVESI